MLALGHSARSATWFLNSKKGQETFPCHICLGQRLNPSHQGVRQLTVHPDVILRAYILFPPFHPLLSIPLMAPTTRSTERPKTPEREIKRREHDTVEKSRFYQAYDMKSDDEGLRSICKSENIPRSTARDWLRQRTLFGNAAYRKTRALSDNIGRKEQVLKETYQMLVSDSNPVRNRNYEQQI